MTTVDGDERALSDPDRVSLWLTSNDGSAAVRRVLLQLQLPESFDSDLVAKTVHGAERMEDRGEAIESIPAWVKRTLRLRAMDLLASPRSSRAAISPTEAEQLGIDVIGGAAFKKDIAALMIELESDDIRRDIGERCDVLQPWRASAALTYLSVALDGCAPGSTCPAPVGGADELDAAQWAGLFYAEQHQCFAAGGEPDTATIRQRRKRRIDDVRQLLIDAYGRAQGGADRG